MIHGGRDDCRRAIALDRYHGRRNRKAYLVRGVAWVVPPIYSQVHNSLQGLHITRQIKPAHEDHPRTDKVLPQRVLTCILQSKSLHLLYAIAWMAADVEDGRGNFQSQLKQQLQLLQRNSIEGRRAENVEGLRLSSPSPCGQNCSESVQQVPGDGRLPMTHHEHTLPLRRNRALWRGCNRDWHC